MNKSHGQNYHPSKTMSAVSSRVRESLLELHAHVDFVFRDSNASSISVSQKKNSRQIENSEINLASHNVLAKKQKNIAGAVDSDMLS